MSKIGLLETINALRDELRECAKEGESQDILFPLGGIQLEFQVGITKEASTDGKVNVWVLELGSGGSYARESVQTVTITLEPPLDKDGRPLRITRRTPEKP